MTTRRLLITALGIGLVAAHVYFWMDSLTQRREQEALASQITDVTQTMAQIPKPSHDLEQRLAEAQANLAAERRTFSGELNSTRVIDTFLRLADESQVRAGFLTTEPWTPASIEGHDYLVLVVHLEVEGSLDGLVAFVRRLENESPAPVRVQYVSVTREDGQPTESSMVTASLDVTVYSQPPTSD